jgi:DNA-binding GntR family transcriptional regulator
MQTLGARHEPLNKLVADAIRERILAGEFPPGERLAEERLSDELGVSRMPVREALRALASEGIVTLEPRRGASVTAYTEAQVQELVEVRATLEGLNARLAAKRHDPKQIAELKRILEAGSKITEQSALGEIQANNERFHAAVEAIAANSVLMNIVRSLRDRTALIFAKQSRKRVRENWNEHAGIVRAVIAGDAELAGLLASRHVYNAARMPEEGEAAKPASGPAPKAASKRAA